MDLRTLRARLRIPVLSVVLLLLALPAGSWTDDPIDEATLEVTTEVAGIFSFAKVRCSHS